MSSHPYKLHYYPKPLLSSANDHFLNMFQKNLIPGKMFCIFEEYSTTDGDGYTYERGKTISNLFLKVISVTPPPFVSFYFTGKYQFEKANAIVELPSGRQIPLFVHDPDKYSRPPKPGLVLNDVIYQELKKVRYANLPTSFGAFGSVYYSVNIGKCYDDNAELISAMKNAQEKRAQYQQKKIDDAARLAESKRLAEEAERQRQSRNNTLQSQVEKLFRKL